jgi:hypothetical protein
MMTDQQQLIFNMIIMVYVLASVCVFIILLIPLTIFIADKIYQYKRRNIVDRPKTKEQLLSDQIETGLRIMRIGMGMWW